ncbi:MAG: ketopantoate reductase family protein [Bdellovibrionales bacterium]|nr:ketopantoate reductase family protein [Bdellovibrionales bacterium]
MKKIRIIGAGSVGSFLAARLKTSGVDVELISHSMSSKSAVTIRAESEVSVPIGPYSGLSGADQIWVTTKAAALPLVLSQIAKVSELRNVPLVFFQNGIGVLEGTERLLSSDWLRAVCWFGVRKEVLGPTDFRVHVAGVDSVEWGGPGASRFGREFSDALKIAGVPGVHLEDADQVEWRKALWNISSNALCAVAQAPNGHAEADPELRPLAELLYAEAAAVAKARGVKLAPDVHDRCFAGMKKTATNLNSMLMDLRGGKKTELPWLNQKVVDWGAQVGVPTPSNAWICGFIRYFESKGPRA